MQIEIKHYHMPASIGAATMLAVHQLWPDFTGVRGYTTIERSFSMTFIPLPNGDWHIMTTETSQLTTEPVESGVDRVLWDKSYNEVKSSLLKLVQLPGVTNIPQPH